jgi:PAS domain S-box-containing protein
MDSAEFRFRKTNEKGYKGLRSGDHLCVLYKSEDELLEIWRAWIEDGLQSGQRVLLIMDVQDRKEALSRLGRMGREWEATLKEGRLDVLTVHESFLQQGNFNPESMVAFLNGKGQNARKDGYKALRVIGEMGWAIRDPNHLRLLLNYEASLGSLLEAVPLVVVCLYDKRIFDEDFLVKVLMIHPYVAEGRNILSNPSCASLLPSFHEVHKMGPLELFLQGLRGYEKEFAEVHGTLSLHMSIMERIQDGVIVLKGGRARLIKKAAVDITGYSEDEISKLSPKDLVHPEDLAQVEDAMQRAFTGEGPFEMTCRIRRKDGVVRWVRTIIDSMKFEGENALVILFRDITDRRRLEEQFLQAQRMESVGRLASGIAHDFNNLMTAVMGYADLLKIRLPEDDPLQRDVEQIRKAGQRAASLTRQLLAFSRKQFLSPQILNINEIIRDLQKMLGRLMEEDIEIETLLADGLGSVNIDPVQLEQVIVNLAVNARDAMPNGGKLIIETANVELDETYAQSHPAGVEPGSYVMLAMTDTGVGMDQDTRLKVFEPFFTTKRPGEGTGLGLSTVYGIVRQSGGHIWVYSEPGRGTTFKIYLPRVQGKSSQWRRKPTTDRLLRGNETVLVVEDDEDVLRITTDMLHRLGYRVLETCEPSEAIDIMESKGKNVALLLVDVVL